MTKKSSKSKRPRARAVKDLPVSDTKAKQAKGGFLGGLSNTVKGLGKTVSPTTL